jgi:hypothetical protein
MPFFKRYPGAKPEFIHTTDRPSSDRLAELEEAFGALFNELEHINSRLGHQGSRIGNLEDRDQDQQEWNAECESRVQPKAPVTNYRSCPGCGASHPDGVWHWPGYISASHPGDPRCRNCFPKDGLVIG